MEETLQLILLGIIGIFAGFLNVTAGGGSLLTLPFLIFLGLPPAVANRLARIALRRAGSDGRRISALHVEGLLDLARGGRGRHLHLPSRIKARRERDRIVIGPEPADPDGRIS